MALEVDPNILIALVSLSATIIVAYLNKGKFTKTDAVKLENRLTSLEVKSDAIKDVEGRLSRLETKIDPIWNFICKQLPKMFIQPSHVQLDMLLQKAIDSNISKPEKEDLKKRLTKIYDEAIKEKNIGKAMAVALYNATLLV